MLLNNPCQQICHPKKSLWQAHRLSLCNSGEACWDVGKNWRIKVGGTSSPSVPNVLGSYQPIFIRSPLLLLVIQTTRDRLLIFKAAMLKDAGKPYSKDAAQAKLMASETATFAAHQAIQVKYGVTWCTEVQGCPRKCNTRTVQYYFYYLHAACSPC